MPSRSRLTVTEHREGAGCLLEAEGELDVSTIRRLSEPLMSAVGTPTVWPVTVDLSRLVYIDSAGLAVLLTAAKETIKHSRRLRIIAAPSSQPEQVLKRRQIDMMLDVVSAPDESTAGEMP